MMNMASTIIAMASGTYTVTRKALGTYVRGRNVPSASASSFTIQASVQAMGGRELMRLSEAMRTRETLVVYTPTELKTQSADQEPDTISIRGRVWEVQEVEDWSNEGGYYKAIVSKVGD